MATQVIRYKGANDELFISERDADLSLLRAEMLEAIEASGIAWCDQTAYSVVDLLLKKFTFKPIAQSAPSVNQGDDAPWGGFANPQI